MSWFSSTSIEQPVEQPVQTPGVLLHEPDALLVQKVLVAQRPDRAQIDHVARQLVVQRIAGEDVDLFVAAAIDDHQLAGAGDLAGEAHAAACTSRSDRRTA